MNITKGTPQAMSLLAELKETDDLVDVYSNEFFDRQPTYDEDPSAPFTQDGMITIDDMENASDEDAKPKNHLIFIFVNENDEDIHDKLVATYPPLKKIFDQGHLPDFLLLNLHTRQMLCVGFGRKNRMFIVDAKTGNGINAFDLVGTSDDSEYMYKFLENDAYECVSDFVHALHELSLNMYEYDNLPGNEELVELALDDTNTRNGLHYIEGDNKGYSNREIQELIAKYHDLRRQEDEAMKMIKVFFPHCDRGELNTGDYPF